MKRKYHRKRNDYYKTVFHDEEIYHCSFAETKESDVWKKVDTWSTTNAWNWKLTVMPYPLVGRFNELCSLYRWVKFNYISFYFVVSAYTYQGPSDMELVLQEETVSQKKKKKITGAIRN